MMKILSLNIWGGRVGKEKLLNFLATQNDADVICLQEVWSAPYENFDGDIVGGSVLNQDKVMVRGKKEISELLLDYESYFRPHFMDDYGLFLLVHKRHTVMSEGEVFVHLYKGYMPAPTEDIGTHARNIQYVTIEKDGSAITVMNFHGLWNGKGKDDSDARLEQSDNIIAFLKTLTTPVVLCGDFNLNPTTESIKRLEDAGLRNLVAEYGITSTRTGYYTKPEKFADYAFVSKELVVHDFKVLPDEVSDHSPLEIIIA